MDIKYSNQEHTSKWILNDKNNVDLIGVQSSSDYEMSISKVQTIMPVKVGVQSSWNSQEEYYTSFKYLFDFNVYKNKITNNHYISNNSISSNDDKAASSNLWEWFGLDTTNDARSELFLIDQLITNDSSIFKSSKEFWLNKGFGIEIKGDTNLEDYEDLIDADLII